MRVFITGICGFLGSHLREKLLEDGHSVHGNDSLICGDVANCLSFSDVDCRNYDEMHSTLRLYRPDVLIHCAATAHEGLSSFSPSFITRNIYEASVATFSAAIASGVKRIVYMSSMARYGRQTPPFTEDMTPMPVDPYGIAKVAAEDTLRVLAETHGIKYAIAVPHNIIGTRQRSVDPYRNVAAIMVNRCKQGKPPIIYGDGMQTRCFSPVADCIPSILRMVHGDADGEIVNIGPDNGEITIKELAETLCRLTGLNYSADGEPVHVDGRPNEVKHAYTSSDKARRLLGFEPKQSLEDCLKEMVQYIQPQPFVYDFPIEIHTERTPKTWTERLM